MCTLKSLSQTLQYLLNLSVIFMVKYIGLEFCCNVTICLPGANNTYVNYWYNIQLLYNFYSDIQLTPR